MQCLKGGKGAAAGSITNTRSQAKDRGASSPARCDGIAHTEAPGRGEWHAIA